MLYPCKSGWNLPISSWDMVRMSTFGLKFGSLSTAVTLKIRSRSPKPNQLFIMSQCYIHANLVKIHQLVANKKVSCRRRRQQDPYQKQYVPLPFSRGHNERFGYKAVSICFNMFLDLSFIIFYIYFFFITVLQPVKIISLTLSRGAKMRPQEKTPDLS